MPGKACRAAFRNPREVQPQFGAGGFEQAPDALPVDGCDVCGVESQVQVSGGKLAQPRR